MKAKVLLGFATLLIASACIGSGLKLDTESSGRLHKAMPTSGLTIPVKDGAIQLKYGGFDGANYHKVTFIKGNKIIRVIDDEYGHFEVGPPSNSPGNRFSLIHQVDSGSAKSDEELEYHDRYYCMFVSTQNACVVARRTGAICAGEWADSDTWNSYNGSIEMEQAVISAAEVAAGDMFLTGAPESSFENLLLCDPPTSDNKEFYESIRNKN